MAMLYNNLLKLFPALCWGLVMLFGTTRALAPTVDPRIQLLNLANNAGIKTNRLVPFDYSWILTGPVDPRIRVHGLLETTDVQCRSLPDSWQVNRTGLRTACQCEKILYNRDGAALNRFSDTRLRELGKVTGGVAFSSNATWLNTGIKYVEAGICYPGPCCPLITSGDKAAAITLNALDNVYASLPLSASSVLFANFLPVMTIYVFHYCLQG
ncbi:uncharacterized protein LOC129594786 [Paramacrobiotus metropolitanus]|uniref:uncharacterized protein LOC129594786 n=1 Tax=Paramacrobiotus metropolitanus TaxID=2943436 RepID=UPI00244636AC|nr:uncharacterized protein LOC129594786 [Paramacrobiotus metropolitanus]